MSDFDNFREDRLARREEVRRGQEIDFQAPEGCTVEDALLYDLAAVDPLLVRLDKAICPIGIEFTDLKGFTKVTAEARAVARFELPDATDGTLVPMVRNPAGEFVALGCGTISNGLVEVTFSALPPPALPSPFGGDNFSSPKDAPKLCIALKFFPFALADLPTEPILDVVNVVEDHTNTLGFRAERGGGLPDGQVRDGSVSVLFVHDFAGRTGDTPVISKALAPPNAYAHVFSFDYDSLGGSVEDAAVALKEQLEGAGFRFGAEEELRTSAAGGSRGAWAGGNSAARGIARARSDGLAAQWTGWSKSRNSGADGHDVEGKVQNSIRPPPPAPLPKLDVVAYGIGGLVVRALVELMGGESVVRHLTLIGTPNTGVPVRDVVTAAQYGVTLLALAANNLVKDAALEGVVLTGAAYALMPQLPPILADAQPGGELMRALVGPPPVEDPRDEPRVVYSTLCGDINDPLVDQLLFFGRPNDLVVSIEGAKGRFSVRAPINDSPPVPVSHFSMMSDPRSIDALRRIHVRAEHERDVRLHDRRAAEVWEEEAKRQADGPNRIQVPVIPPYGAPASPPKVPLAPPLSFGATAPLIPPPTPYSPPRFGTLGGSMWPTRGY